MGGLEEDVIAGIAGGEFFGDFLVEVVGGVLGLPVAVGEGEFVHQGAVEAQGGAGFFQGVLLHQGEAALFGAVAQEGGEGRGDGAFGIEIKVAEGLELLIVGLDGLVGGFEVEGEHGQLKIPPNPPLERGVAPAA